jgi:alginate O-acetyltransferase complex protein AlgI
LALSADQVPESALGLAGVGALLLAIHLGICDVLPWLVRWAGFDAPLLFDRPWKSRTLTEFWGKRWNLVFIEMNQRLFLRPAFAASAPTARDSPYLCSRVFCMNGR